MKESQQLLQALVAPLVLIASVVVSFFGTLGLAMLCFRYVFGENGVDNSLPVFAFIFLVALGIDYTIFLMSRVREEARKHGTRVILRTRHHRPRGAHSSGHWPRVCIAIARRISSPQKILQ